MKLLQINIVVNNGSTGKIAEEIGIAIQNKGWESYIAYGRRTSNSKSIIIKIGNKFDIFFHLIMTRIFDKHGLYSKKATRQLINKIEIIKPDIIHLHNIHGYYLNYKELFEYLKTLKTPIVWTLHDCWPITGHCSHFTDIKCKKWKVECNSCPQKKTYPKSIIFDRSKENYHNKKEAFNSIDNLTLITVSDWLSNIYYNSFLSKHKIKRIYNGIDINIFKPTETPIIRNKYNLESKFIILGVASTWSESKGLDDFIELNKILDDDYRIILIGLDSKMIKKLPQGIIGISRTENQVELAKYYSTSDVYINTSTQETFGLTTAESLSCGTPCIVYNSTACPEIISSETGFVVEPNDINMIYNTIQIIKSKGKYYYKEKCRQRVIDNFLKEDRYSEYTELYDSILNTSEENQ